jgi:hypothetical protein
MKQTFLDSLEGMTVKAATTAIETEGYEAWILPEGAITILIARGGTVKLYHNTSGIVTSAHAGDPLELE